METFEQMHQRIAAAQGNGQKQTEKKAASSEAAQKKKAQRVEAFQQMHQDVAGKYAITTRDDGSDDFVKSFLRDSQKYIREEDSQLRKMDWKDANDAAKQETRAKVAQNMTQRATQVRQYLQANQANILPERYSLLMSYLNDFDDDVRGIRTDTEKMRQYYSQWGTEDDYKQYTRQAKQQSWTPEEYEMMAAQAQQAYEDYMKSDERKAAQQALVQGYVARHKWDGLRNGFVGGTVAPGRMDIQELTDSKEQELKAKAEYYRNLADQAENKRITEANLKELESWSEAEKLALETYIAGNPSGFGSIMEHMGAAISGSGAARSAAGRNSAKAQQAFQLLAAKHGAQKVRQLAESLEWYHNQQATEQVEQYGRSATDGKVGASIAHSAATVPANLGAAITAPIAVLSQLATRTGQYKTLDPNSMGNILGAYSGAVRGQVAENISGDEYNEFGKQTAEGGTRRAVASLAYQGLMSSADSLARAALGGGSKAVSLGLAATGSFGQTVSDASRQGATAGQAVLLGVITGGLEVATEYLPLDEILKVAQGGAVPVKQLIKNIMKQAAIEITEEEVSLFGSFLAEAVILREKSSYKRQIAEEVANGASYEAAKSKADWALLVEAMETAVSSGFSGGGSAFAGSTAANARTEKTGKELYGADPRSLVDEALEIDGENEYAKDLQSRLNKGKKISGRELFTLAQRNEQTLTERDVEAIRIAVEDRLYQLGEPGDLERIAEILTRQATGEELTRAEKAELEKSRYGQRVANELDAENISSGGYASDWTRNIGTERIRTDDFNEEDRHVIRKDPVARKEMEAPAGTAGETVIVREQGSVRLAQHYGVFNTKEQWNEAKQVAEDTGVNIKLYTDYADDRDGYVEDGDVYINTETEKPMAQIVQQFIDAQQRGVTKKAQNVPQMAKNVTQKGQNVPQDHQNVTKTGESVTVRGQAQEDNQNLNGGTEYGNAVQRTEPDRARDGVLHGSEQRNDSAGAGEQTGGMAERTGSAAQGRRTGTDRIRTQNQRNALGRNLRLPQVSSASLGIKSGTDAANLQVIPEEHWDDGMRQKAEQVYEETGKQVTYVLGRIQIKGIGGKVTFAKGIANDDGIIVQANHPATSAEQIADHEAYHGMRFVHGQRLNSQLIQKIREEFTEGEFDKVIDRYVVALRETIDVAGAQTGEEFQQRMQQIMEEILADAHAGVNSFGAGATQFTDTVNKYLDENWISRRQTQENGTRQTNGPPAQAQKNTADDGSEMYLLDEESETTEKTGYEGRSLTEDGSIYTYDFLIKQPDMSITMLPEVNTVRSADGKIIPGDVVSAGMENARTVGTERAGDIYVTNRYTGRELWVTAASVRHGLNGAMNRKLTNARLGSVIGEIVQNAIPINSLNNTAENVVGTYAMAGYATDSKGREFVAIVTVEQRGNSVTSVDVFDVTHAVSGRQKNGSNRNNPAASDGGSQANTKFQGINLIKTSSKISISDLLEVVKDTYQSILSEDVLNRFGEERNPKGHYYDRVRYSIDELDEEEYARWQERSYEGKAPTQQELERERQAWLQQEYNQKVRQQENKPSISKRELRSTLMGMFSIPDGQKAELGKMIDNYADRLIKNGMLTEDDRRIFFDRMYGAGVMTVPADEYMAMGRSYLVDSRIYVDDSVRADFGDDWESLRRRAFAVGVYLTRNPADPGIDVWNHDLSSPDMVPGLFDSEETDLRTILEQIVSVAEAGKDEQMSLAEYTKRMAGQDFISEDEFLDEMERKMDWALRTFAEKAGLEVRLRNNADRRVKNAEGRVIEKVARHAYKDLQRRAKEREARKEMSRKQRVRKELQELQKKTLKQLQWLSKNRNRAPEELRSTWDEVLGDIDIYAVSAANEMNWSSKYNATWEDLAQMYKDAMTNDPNFLPSKDLERIVARLDGSKIADMDLGALQDLYKAAIGLRTEFYNRNNVINDEMQRLFEEVYTDVKKEMDAAPGGFTGDKVEKFFNLDQLTPMNVLERMGGWDPNGTFYSMAKQLERGERDMRAYSVKAQRMLQDFLTEHEDWVKKADGQGEDAVWYELEVPQLVELGMGNQPIFGPTVTVYMTPAQKVHMYLESKNLDNLRHMTGGRTFVDKELYSQGKRQEALSQGRTIRLAPETVKKLVSDLTEEEMELAKILDRYYNTFATKEINRVSNILYGYDKAMGKNYAPIYTNRNYTKTEFGVFDTTAEGVGNLKGRQYAVNPSYNISAFDAFERHVDQTSRFVGMAIPARNWTTLMNWRERNSSTGDIITHKWGEESKKYITDLITTLQAGEEIKTDTVSSTLGKLQSNYITAVFGANPSIVLKQLGSIPMASAYLGAKNAPSVAQIRSIDRDLIAMYTQDLEWRTMGYSMPETKYLKDNPTKLQSNKFCSFVFGGDAITAMDGWAASTLWPWAENKVRSEHPELEVGTAEQVAAGESPFYKKVAEEFEDALARSQSTSDEIHQSSLRKSKNPLTKVFTMFRSDSAQTYNTIRQKIGEAQYLMRKGDNEEAVKIAKKAVGQAVMAMLLNAAWSETVSFLMALWKNKGKHYRDEEEELTWQSIAGEMAVNMISSLAGTVTIGEELFEVVGNVLTGEKIYDIEAPGLEQLNDAVDAVSQAGAGMRKVFSGAVNVVVNGGSLLHYLGKNAGELISGIKEVTETACVYLGGVPVSNVEAYLMGALKWIAPALGTAFEDAFTPPSKSDLNGMTGSALTARVSGLFDSRDVDVGSECAATLGRLYAAGYKKAIPSDIPTSITIDGESHKLNEYQKQSYGLNWANVVSGTIDKLTGATAFKTATPEMQEKMLNYLYTYAGEMTKAQMFEGYDPDTRDEAIAAFRQTGLSLADFLIAYGKYSEVNGMDLRATEKAVQFAHWIEKQNYTPAQRATVKDNLSYYNMAPASTAKYDKMVESGIDPDLAMDVNEGIKELREVDASDAEYWRLCIESSDNEEAQMALLYSWMDEKTYTKAKLVYDLGVSPSMFVEYFDRRSQYDLDENGYYSVAESKNAIDAIGEGYTDEQKGVLWQMCTGSKSTKNNPYSKSAGQKYLDAKNAQKAE